MIQTTGLRIYLLGPLRLEREGKALHLPRRKVESLLAYLLLHPERHPRDQLATLLWGDSSDEQARHSLRTALATLRKELAPDLLLADRDFVQLNPDFPCWVDLRDLFALQTALDTIDGDLLLARVALWRGELLASLYDDWITQDREFYHTHLLTLCLRATQALRTRSDYARAVEVAQRVLAFDPANEHAHQHLMFCYMASGDRPAALRQYELCERALRDELDAPPMTETTELYRWIKQQSGEDAAPAAKITNLPIPLTSFIGRTQQMTEVKRLLSPLLRKTRLLTLTGAGGSGKTRLAIQSATDLIDGFTHGVWWVELAALNAGEQVVSAVAQTLGVREHVGEPLLRSVIDFLGDKQLLLVIDNCEHLIEPAAHLAAELLRRCPNLQLLVTSREALNIAGETILQTPPLGLPVSPQGAPVDALLQIECIRLFVERAGAMQAGFRLTPENAHAVVRICAQLDGIPLAIELAAARVKLLPVAEIAARLTGALGARFTLLTQGSRAALPRHQTLRAAIDWSYDLLDPAERQLFRQAAVFRGGFTLDALEQVVEIGDWRSGIGGLQSPSSKLLDLLTQLADKSLVIVEPHGAQNRYRLLETLREYALEQFATADELKQLQRRHAEYYLAFAERAEPELTRAEQYEWLNRIETEHHNLRAALDYWVATADGEMALRLAAALHTFWETRGYVSEGREWLRKVLTHQASATIATQAWALNAAGFLAFRQSDFAAARPMLEAALALFEQAGESMGVAKALQNLAIVEMRQGDHSAAQQHMEQSLYLCQALNYNSGIARAFNFLGNLAWDRGQITIAREHYLESLRLNQIIGDQAHIASGYFNIGNTARQLGDFASARTNYAACLTISRALGHKGLMGVTFRNLGRVAFEQQAYVEARQYGEEALSILREFGDKSNIGFTLSSLGDVAHKLGETDMALAYYCQNLQLLYEIDYKRLMFSALEQIARLLAEVDRHPEDATRFVGAAARLRAETDIPVAPDHVVEHERLLDRLQERLGVTAFDVLRQEGERMPLDQVIAEATQLSLN
jgi:predicted ATPase/DNA-binding SARP family transcriptional activator